MRIPIPQIQRQQTPSAPGSPPMARAVGMGGVQDLAQGLGQIARDREQTAARAEDNFARLEFEQKKTRNVERLSAARLEWAETMQKRQAEADPAADGFTRQALTDFDGWRKKSAEAIPDEEERRMFDSLVLNVREHVLGNAMQFEATQRRSYRKRVVDDGIDTDSRTVIADPSQFRDVLGARLAAIKTSSDLSAEERAALTEKARETISINAGSTLVNRDPVGWLQRDPTKDPLLSVMSPTAIRQLNGHAAALVKQAEAHNRTEQDKALKLAEKTTEDVQKFVVDGGLVSPGYENQVRALVKGTPYAPMVDSMVQVSKAGAGFGNLPLPRQREMITALKPGDPDQAKLLDHIRTVNSRQEKAYADDPWSAWSTFARGPQTSDADLSRPGAASQVVAQRNQQIDALETVTGFAVSPLKPAEATAWADKLATLPPDARAAELGSVGAQLPAPRISALADQLDSKNKPLALALKLGADQTTAGRNTSALVLRGAQAIADKTIKRDDTALSGWRSEISGMVRGTLGDDRAEQDIIDAAYYVRASMDAEGTAVQGFDLKASNENAVRMVIGRPMEREGVKTILPRLMDESQFDAKLREFTPDVLRTMAPDGVVYIRNNPIKVEALSMGILSYGMKRDGRGNYIPVRGNALVTVDKAGTQPLRLGVQ